MPSQKDKKVRRSSNYEYIYLNQSEEIFIIEDFVNNPSRIRKLFDDYNEARRFTNTLIKALEGGRTNMHDIELEKKDVDKELEAANHEIKNLKSDLERMNSESSERKKEFEQLLTDKHNIDLKLSRANERLEAAGRNSIIQFLLSTAATLLIAFGVNIVTATSSDWKGWTFIIIAISLAMIAFFMVGKKK